MAGCNGVCTSCSNGGAKVTSSAPSTNPGSIGNPAASGGSGCGIRSCGGGCQANCGIQCSDGCTSCHAGCSGGCNGCGGCGGCDGCGGECRNQANGSYGITSNKCADCDTECAKSCGTQCKGESAASCTGCGNSCSSSGVSNTKVCKSTGDD